ncbi:MAG TPA: hypothetical protein PKO06_22590, partial [Candidatus Ozemobacteraceae bacterium]|nr:hypothetical protein [Candidatus Ozemobacteraceae bacterium]
MLRKSWLLCFALVLWAGSSALPVFAQASLADGDTLDLAISIDGVKEGVTCIRDAVKPNQWYYVPKMIRLDTVMDPNLKKERPQFALVKYQGKDPDDPQKLLEGGVLQCSFNLSLPGKSVTELRKKLAEHANVAEKDLLLTPLSMSDGSLSIYTPGGDKMGEAPQAPDIAPTFANQSIPVQINLTRLGADFVDALTKSGGIQVYVVFNYNGLTPKAGFRI